MNDASRGGHINRPRRNLASVRADDRYIGDGTGSPGNFTPRAVVELADNPQGRVRVVTRPRGRRPDSERRTGTRRRYDAERRIDCRGPASVRSSGRRQRSTPDTPDALE